VNNPEPTISRQQEGRRRKNAVHGIHQACREVYIRRARRSMLIQLLEHGSETADDVAERTGPAPGSLDPRFLGAAPRLLACAGIIRRTRFTLSFQPSRRGATLKVWELADRAGALDWLAHNPDLRDSEPRDG
jgi:hypothetical protein